MYMHIESAKNENIKSVRKLYMKKYRDSQGLFLAEGKKLFSEAVNSGYDIEKVIVSESLYETERDALLKNNSARTYIVPDSILVSISEQKSPEGIITVVRKPKTEVAEALSDTKAAVLLDQIKDPGNIGTIIRSADAFGADTIIVSPDCVDVWSPKAIRASMGSCFHVQIVLSKNTIEDIQISKELGFTLLAGDLKGKDKITKLDKALIAIGSESHGLSKEVLSKADVLYKIPMRGKAESLNASVAASIMLYETCNKIYTDVDQ